MSRVAIIGGGAAGCFCAVEIKRRSPLTEVSVLEASARPMTKLGLTGGGRCNISNTFGNVTSLKDIYPRGERLMKRLLMDFGSAQCREWWEDAGIGLVEEDGGRLFPRSQRAQDVVGKLLTLMNASGVELRCGCKVKSICKEGDCYCLHLTDGSVIEADKVVVCTGGSPQGRLSELLKGLDIKIEKELPSLFTLKVKDNALRSLMGISAEVSLGIEGFKQRAEGSLLITDWGISGPACLKLSSYAARFLAERNYSGTLQINWLKANDEEARTILCGIIAGNKGRLLSGVSPQGLPSRLWKHLLERSGIRADIRCAELGAKGMARLCSLLCCDNYPVCGRAAFKEEFVTCGGVACSEINPTTLESKKNKGLWFAGEALDIDAVTGGFNLQAAWTTAYIAAKAISEA